MDPYSVANPYNFAHPVSQQRLFIGRDEEMQDIRYYLDQANLTLRPTNLLLIGPRASGKTSLLNMAAHEARERAYCVVRVDLDEDDASTQLAFFFKLFDSILAAACERGAFLGLDGKTYDSYLEMVASNSLPTDEDRAHYPFLFPFQYVRAIQAGNSSMPVSEFHYRRDLAAIRAAVNCPIILLFDECNVLSKSRVHLEKLRNLFQSLDGFMLIMAGTPNLFPVIDDVFSPMMRQFKKLQINQFSSLRETEECIRKPLETAGLAPASLFNFRRDLSDIHDLCSGKPYEIQLLCHTLFRRVQMKRADRMRLDLSVLEEVLNELASTQDLQKRPVLTAVRSLSRETLAVLNILCACDKHASLDDIWAVEYVMRGTERWAREQLEAELKILLDNSILTLQNDKLCFTGDDFDKVYCKYYAREQRIALVFSDSSVVEWLARRLSGALTTVGLHPLRVPSEPNQLRNLMEVAELLSAPDSTDDVFSESPTAVLLLYRLMMDHRSLTSLPIISITASWPSIDTYLLGHAQIVDGELDRQLDELTRQLAPIRDRARELGGDVSITTHRIAIPQVHVLEDSVLRSANADRRRTVCRYHFEHMLAAYPSRSDLDDAIFHADILTRYDPVAMNWNNLGYLRIAHREYEQAKSCLETAMARSADGEEDGDVALVGYNLALVALMQDQYGEARRWLNSVTAVLDESESAQRSYHCLFCAQLIDGTVELIEDREAPDLRRCVLLTMQALDQLEGSDPHNPTATTQDEPCC
jgi:hypothetical protein